MNRQAQIILFSFIFILTALRLFFIANTMLIDDEAYYAIYARHLNWGYIDHGPVIAYLIRFFTILIENSFTVRLGGVVSLTILCYLLYQFGKTYYSRKTGMILALTVCVSMMFHISAIVITPDAPLAFFTILSIIYYYKAYFIHEKYLYPAGLFMGLSILSKISAIFPAIGILLFPVIVKEKWHYLKNRKFYLALIIAFLIFTPFIYWNIQNDMAFVRYQGSHIMEKGSWLTFIELWMGILLLCGPVLFYYTLILPIQHLIKIKSVSADKIYFSLVTFIPLIYFLLHSFFSRMELNWPFPVFMGGIFLFGIYIGECWKNSRGLLLFQLGYSLILIFTVTIHTFSPILPIINKSDITDRYFTYNVFLDNLSEYLNQNPDLNQKRILSNNFQIPSMINFYLNPELEAGCLSIGYHETLYSFLYHDDQLKGNDFLYLFEGKNFPEWLKPYFDDYKILHQFESVRGSKIISAYSLWQVTNYHGKNI